MKRLLVQTEDGTLTLQDERTGETFHSLHGAVNESRHIYIDYGWKHWISGNPHCREITLLEMGFGTGLNALLTYWEAQKSGIKVHYHTYELYPLEQEEYNLLAYPLLDVAYAHSTQEVLQQMHTVAWDVPMALTPNFILHKHREDFTQATLPGDVDVVYFDAFSPNVEPQLWTLELFRRLYLRHSFGGVLTTYCAKGCVRRALEQAGYGVERLPGPIGKREVLRATKRQL